MANKRKELLIEGETYHIYNRSIAEVDIFNNQRTVNRALSLMDFYRYPQIRKYSKFRTLPEDAQSDYLQGIHKNCPLVEIYAFSLMPNHYHFLLKQTADRGISLFISNFQNGFAKYFNLKNKRDGGLFKSPFKSKHIARDEDLLQVSRYIHLNPVTSYLMELKDLAGSTLTSYPYYLGKLKQGTVKTDLILALSGSGKNYSGFVADHAGYQRKLGDIKRLILEK